MKKRNSILASVVAIIVLVSAVIGVVACTNKGNAKVSAFNDALNYSTVGAVELLKGTNYSGVSANLGENSNVVKLSASSGTLTDEEKELILNNLAVAQNTLSGGVVKSEVKPSSREGYQFEYTLSAPSITGEDNVYKFYYNSTLKEDLDDDDDDDFDDDDFDDDDDFEEYIKGVVVLDEIEYSVLGEREIEEDEEEVTFLIKLDENNYVEIENEKESDEEEYSYTLYKNGRKVFETEVEFEKDEKGKTELKFEIEQNGVEIEYSYEFEENKNGKFVKVEIEKDDDNEVIAIIQIIENEDGKVEYKFIERSNNTQNSSTTSA